MTPLPCLFAAMMLAMPNQPARAVLLHVSLCDGSSATIPIEHDQSPERDCPSACHAAPCQSRKRPL